MTAGTRLCTFTLDDRCYGIDIEKVQEILRPHSITRVPLAPEAIRGLINLRGQIVTAIDLRVCLGIERPAIPPAATATATAPAASMSLVVRTSHGEVSFLVDEIGDVVEITPGIDRRPPETLRGAGRDLITGALQHPDTLILVLDVEKVADPATIAGGRRRGRRATDVRPTAPNQAPEVNR